MTTARIGTMRADLTMSSVSFEKGIDNAQRRMRKFQRNMRRMGRDISTVGRTISVGFTLPLVGAAYKAVAAHTKQERAVASVTAALHSMGNAAGYTRGELLKMASSLQSQSLYGDEEILQKVTANLLTFGKVQGDVFARAQQAALDLSARLGTDLQSSALQIGKALNDVGYGLTSLTRSGIQFTEAQKDQIRALDASGRTMDAQKIILKELEKQFGGTAKAIASTDSGRITQAWNAIGDAMERVGAIILPIAADFAQAVQRLAERLSDISPRMLAIGTAAALASAALGPLVIATGAIVASLGVLAPIIAPLTLSVTALGAAATTAYFAWEPLLQAFDFAKNNILVLSPVIGALALTIYGKLAPAVAAGAAGLKGMAIAAGRTLVAGLATAAGALKLFRFVLISTGVGALVVGVTWLASKMLDLIKSTGSVGAALVAIKDVAIQVLDRIGYALTAAGYKIASIGASVKASVSRALSSVFDLMPGWVNKIIGYYAGAFASIKVIWSELPIAINNVTGGAVNALIAGLEDMLNWARDAVWDFLGWATRQLNRLPGVNIEIEPIDPIELGRIQSQASNLAGGVKSAFTDAFKVDYTGRLADGLGDIADNADRAAKKLDKMAKSAGGLALAPIVVGGAAGGDIVVNNQAITDALAESMQDLSSTAGDTGKSFSSLSKDMLAASGRIERGLNDMLHDFYADVASGRLEDAFSGVTGALADLAAQSFADIAASQTSQLLGIGASGAAAGAGASGAAAGAGGGLLGGITAAIGGIGPVIAAALPAVGAAAAVAAIGYGLYSAAGGGKIKTTKVPLEFILEKNVGEGLDIDLGGDGVGANTFSKKRTTKTILFIPYGASTSTTIGDVADDISRALDTSFRGVRQSATAAFNNLGVTVSDGVLNSVDLAVQRVNTKGKTDEEIQEAIDAVFAKYGDALSTAIGGIGLDAAQSLGDTQAALSKIGSGFDLFGSQVDTLSADLVVAASHASDALVTLAGGMDEFSRKTADFYDRFYSDSEKLADLEDEIAFAFKQLGLAVPKTDAEFRNLVEAQDLLTQSGQDTFNALINISSQFDDMTDQWDDAAQAAADAAAEQASIAQAQADEQARLAKLAAAEQARIVDEFNRKVNAGRSEYRLDASKYATAFDAKFAFELQNQGKYGNDVIDLQNAELRKQTELLAKNSDGIRDLIGAVESQTLEARAR